MLLETPECFALVLADAQRHIQEGRYAVAHRLISGARCDALAAEVAGASWATSYASASDALLVRLVQEHGVPAS